MSSERERCEKRDSASGQGFCGSSAFAPGWVCDLHDRGATVAAAVGRRFPVLIPPPLPSNPPIHPSYPPLPSSPHQHKVDRPHAHGLPSTIHTRSHKSGHASSKGSCQIKQQNAKCIKNETAQKNNENDKKKKMDHFPDVCVL